MDTHTTIKVNEENAGDRLDRFLTQQTGKSRSTLQRLIREGRVRVDGKPAIQHEVVRSGQEIIVDWPDIERTHERLIPHVVYEGPDFLVIEKPAGLLVHATPSHRETTLVDWLREHVPGIDAVGDPERPGIVHRLDRDVSGLMVIAKTPEMYAHLQDAFRNRTVTKVYTALVLGSPTEDEGEIRFRLARSKRHNGKIAARPEDAEGREALTRYTVLERFPTSALLDVQIETGRTHQIRAHLQAMKLPILGDKLYSAKKPSHLAELARPFLHARLLAFQDKSGTTQTFTSELPAELAEILRGLKR